MENSLLLDLLEKNDIMYYPTEPLSLDDYDDFPIGVTYNYSLSLAIYVDDFDSAHKTIADILCPVV